MESMEACQAVVSVLSCFALLSVLKTVERQRTMNNFRALIERRRLEFVAEIEKSYMRRDSRDVVTSRNAQRHHVN